MSVSMIRWTFFAISYWCLVSHGLAENRVDKPKELLRHQQSHRPLFIDRRLTRESRIQRYAATDETIDDYPSSDSSTESRYNDGLPENGESEVVKNYEIPETSAVKPAAQIRHGRSRGHPARPISKIDEDDETARTTLVGSGAVGSSNAKPRSGFDDGSLAVDAQHVETNETAYVDFDSDVGGVATNATSNVGTSPKVNNNNDNSSSSIIGKPSSEIVQGRTWPASSLGQVATSGQPADFQNEPKSDSRLADSFDQLRKVVAGTRSRGKGRPRDENLGRTISTGTVNVAENSTWYRSNVADEFRNGNAETAIGGYGVLIHGINPDPANFNDASDKTMRSDHAGREIDRTPSDDGSNRIPDDGYRRGGNTSTTSSGDYEDDYWDSGDGPSTLGTDRPDKQHTVQVDIVTRFLRIIENQHLVGENCTAGTDLNLGEGVVDRYAQERFRLEANLAVNRANMLTRLWKYAPDVMVSSEYLLHASVLSMVEFDEDIFAAGNCYDKLQYRERWLFCPFAHRLQDQDGVLVKDLAVEYKYLSNSSEWFYIARKNAERVIASNNQFSYGYHSYTHNESTHTNRVEDEILTVKYEDGRWSKPYYDCGGGNIWMLTYTVPFFGYMNDTYFFKGTSGIDIDLRRVDIDQCPLPQGSTQLNIFAASDKCKNRTTECVAIPGLGFRRGSYRCVCKRGYYYPDTKSIERYYNGTVIEEEYEKLMLGEDSQYSENGVFECLPCAEGCEYCEDGSPCVASLNWLMRTALLILECCIIASLPAVILFTWKFGNVKVVRAASPVLLRVIVLGAFCIYCTTIVMYPRPNVVTCTIRVWLREIGFSLTYGALMLKTWRISVIFRVKSAKAVKITDMNLLKRLGIIVTIFAVFLGIRTLVAPPVVIVARTADDLKAYLCRTDWWDHSFTTLEVMFLVWGIRLCIVVRKAPSEFNESRFISMAIYNEFLLSVFLNVSMLFLQSPANPDLLYIIFFCHTQLTVTLLLCLIFGSKAYVVFRGGGKEDAVGKLQGTTGKFISKTCRTQGTSNQTNSISLQQGNFTEEADGITEEFRRLYAQLELLKEKNMRLGNRHLVTKIQAMQEASSRSETQVSTIQAISSSLRLSIEPSSSTMELTEVSSRTDDKSAEIDNRQRRRNSNDFPSKTKPTNKKSLEWKNETDDKSRRTKVSKENEIRTNGDLVECTCGSYDDSEIAKNDDGDNVLAKGVENDDAIREVAEKSEKSETAVVVATENSKISTNPDDDEPVGDAESSTTTRTKTGDATDNNGGSNNGNGAKERGKNKSGHARTHAIVINLDDNSRFSEEVTV